MGWTRANEDPELAASEAPIKIVNGIFFVHRDHLGSSSITTDADGAIKQLADYFPYGKTHFQSDSDDFENDKLYTGKELDEEFGLYYYGARYYQAEVGRFVSADPLMFDKKRLINPQRWNFYSYSLNNPIYYTDPNGLVPDPTDFIAGACGPFLGICLFIKEIAEYAIIGAVVGAASNASTDAGIQYFTSDQINWNQVANSAKIGVIQGAITGPAAGFTQGLQRITLRAGILIVADASGGTAAEIMVNNKSFADAAFQSTFAALAGYGAGKMLMLLRGKQLVVETSKYIEQMYQTLKGESFKATDKEAWRLVNAFIGDDPIQIYDNYINSPTFGQQIGLLSNDDSRVIRWKTDISNPDKHINFEDKALRTNAHVYIK